MGYTTDFIGHIDIEPSLNDDEVAYLSAFSESRRCLREGGPYVVPGNPAAEREEDLPTVQANTSAEGQPGYWCDWVPYWDGCCLSYNGNEKFYSPVPWLRYLIHHFLKPGALASRSGLAFFEGFTFDHVLEGMVVGCRRDNKELFAINVRNNRVTEKILRPADPRYLDYPPLPYELEIDRWDGTTAAEAASAAAGSRGRQPDDRPGDPELRRQRVALTGLASAGFRPRDRAIGVSCTVRKLVLRGGSVPP